MNKTYPRLERRKEKKRLAKYGVETLTESDKKLVGVILDREGYYEPVRAITDDGFCIKYSTVDAVRQAMVRSTSAPILPTIADTNIIELTRKDVYALTKAYYAGNMAKVFNNILLSKSTY